MDGMDKAILKCGDDFFSGLPRRFAVRNDGGGGNDGCDFATPLRHCERSEAIQKKSVIARRSRSNPQKKVSPFEIKVFISITVKFSTSVW
jgi:hypothetical protein